MKCIASGKVILENGVWQVIGPNAMARVMCCYSESQTWMQAKED